MDEKLESAVNVAAKAAGMDAEDFIEAVFRYRKKEYELEDIIAENLAKSSTKPAVRGCRLYDFTKTL